MDGGAAAGWYEVPGGFRYWDGSAWTVHFRQPLPPFNHVLHLLLTVFTCGLWGPAWALLAWQRSNEEARRWERPV